MWAVGCVALEMITGTPLWELPEDLGTKSLEDPLYTRNYLSEEVSNLPGIDPKMISIVKRLLHPDPMHRLTIEDLFKKKFIRKWTNKLNHLKKSRMNLSTRLSSRVSSMLNNSQEQEEEEDLQ